VNSSSSAAGLQAGLWWWCIGIPIAIGYSVFLFRLHRGKVTAPLDGQGY
jgi:cytochrome bd-type quinol oxidase subunit 2